VGAFAWWLATATPPAEPAADVGSNGPVVVIVLAVIAAMTTVLTAAGPVLMEFAKGRAHRTAPGSGPSAPDVPGGSTPPPNPAPPLSPAPTQESNQMVQSAQQGLSMVEAAVLDYRSQRDAAMGRYDAVLADLKEAEDIIREQAVYIAQLEVRIGRPPNYGGRHAPFPDATQNRNRP
jgi:hypothetical protein